MHVFTKSNTFDKTKRDNKKRKNLKHFPNRFKTTVLLVILFALKETISKKKLDNSWVPEFAERLSKKTKGCPENISTITT